MPIASVVADANVLLSAVAGKAALRVFTAFGLTVHVAEFTADEVVEYLPVMARKYAIPSELIEMQWRLLAVHRHPAHVYRRTLPRAGKTHNARHGNNGGESLTVRRRTHEAHVVEEKRFPRYNRVSVRDGSRCCCQTLMR
jgi:hypothetical protein